MSYPYSEGDRVCRVLSKLALVPLFLLLLVMAVAQLMILEVGPFSPREINTGNAPYDLEDVRMTP
ncbi:MAG: hypothetical protein AAFR99_15445 [Cyanobacteria bacterium J06629_9]